MLQEFDKYLASSFAVDYWSDEGIGIAKEKLGTLSNEHWEELNRLIENRDSIWLTRCAEVLGDYENLHAARMLMALAENKNSEVQISALDSMDALLNTVSLSDTEIEKLKAILKSIQTSSTLENTMLDAIKRKITSPIKPSKTNEHSLK